MSSRREVHALAGVLASISATRRSSSAPAPMASSSWRVGGWRGAPRVEGCPGRGSQLCTCGTTHPPAHPPHPNDARNSFSPLSTHHLPTRAPPSPTNDAQEAQLPSSGLARARLKNIPPTCDGAHGEALVHQAVWGEGGGEGAPGAGGGHVLGPRGTGGGDARTRRHVAPPTRGGRLRGPPAKWPGVRELASGPSPRHPNRTRARLEPLPRPPKPGEAAPGM